VKHHKVRRALLLVVAVIAASLTVTTAQTVTRPESVHAASRPNIVVIEVDDMRTDELPYMKQTLALLPGTTFTQNYVSTSLCCPSRAAFLSGQYTQNNHVTDNHSYAKFNHANTLASWLQGSGYFTSIVGKYLNGYGCALPTPPGWNHWQALCSNIYSMYNYSLSDNGNVVRYKTGPTQYQTDVLANRAAATVDEASASGKPFFLWVTPTAPHLGPGNRLPQRYATTYLGYRQPHGPSFNEADVSDKPAWVQKLPLLGASRVRTIQKTEATRLGMLLAADDLVAKVVNELKATGQFDNTVIMFTSDNGFMLGEHRIPLEKEVEFQESLSVPLLISGPGVPVGTNNNLVMNTDLAPTIADLAGVTPARVEDGRSLIPLFNGTTWSNRLIRHYVVGDTGADSARLTKNVVHPVENGLRTSRFSYFEIATGERELYDHLTDPYELTNLAGQPKYAPLESELSSMLAILKTCSGASCQQTLADIPPSAVATGTCVNLECTFDGTRSSDLDGSVVSYQWDFGDGTTGSGATVVHDYASSGTYTVHLTVTDDQGATATDQVIVTGTAANIPPVAQFTQSCTDVQCGFDGTTSYDPDGTITQYAWDFGDGVTSTLPAPSHDYAHGGTYTVSLTVTDNRGGTNTATTSLTVTPPNIPPTARASQSCDTLTCSFDASNSFDPDGSIVNYSWDFGDGNLGSGVTTSHTYEFPGVYAVALVVTDNRGGTDTLLLTTTVTG
jgi:arylsulfatase A-like enzyme/PKD repeat protein